MIHRPAQRATTVKMPRSHFEQMLLNVLANACDAMADGGTVTVTTDAVRIDQEGTTAVAPGPFVRLQVADTGGGLTPELTATAFEPFVTTRGDEEGTGLGLAIVQGIAQDAGGMVTLESRSGGGTVVTMLIPAADAAEGLSGDPTAR